MKKVLTVINVNNALYHHEHGKQILGPNPNLIGDCSNLRGNCTGLSGDCTDIRGNCTYLSGDCTGLRGDCSGLSGNLDEAGLTDEDRKIGVDIRSLITG